MFNVRMNKFDTNAAGNFTMTFANGFTISIAMGDGIYSIGDSESGFSAAEVAAWDASGNWVKLDDNNDVVGWQSPEEVLAIMNKVAAM